jgi:Do/DeqQ family serine protease
MLVCAAAQAQLPAREGLPTLAPVLEKVTPAVVNIAVLQRSPEEDNPLLRDPFFRRFFGMPGEAQPQISAGSGVIVDAKNGYVMTNAHVVKDAREVLVTLKDNRRLPARLVGADAGTDIALLKVEPKGLVEARFGDSDALQVGDFVVAIGNPFGIGQTATSGIVSALGRSGLSVEGYEHFIQTDASINPGNSGGALVDMDGRLVGINTAIFSPSGGSNGIGFAIPANMVKVVVDSARNGTRVRLPWVGATFQPVTSDIAEGLGVSDARGALVADVAPGSPGFRAGLKSGDLVTSIDGVEIDDPSSLNYRLATKGIGATVKLGLIRGGKPYVATLALEAAPETVPRDAVALKGNSPLSGATVVNLSPAVAEELGYNGNPSGVIVSDVASGSIADQTGFAKGDVILAVNGRKVASTEDVSRATEARPRIWDLTIERNGRILRSQFRG